MTGFGSARAAAGPGGGAFEVEVRSVNHRHVKVSIRLPEGLTPLLPRLETLVRERVSRGTVYLQVRRVGAPTSSAWRLDGELLKRLHIELSQVATELGVEPPSLGEVALLPGVVREGEASADADRLWPPLQAAAEEALAQLDAMRCTEGAGIARELRAIVEEMRGLARALAEQGPRVVREQGERLRERVRQLVQGEVQLEPGDLAREVALLADKGDISEELQRLQSHGDQLLATLSADGQGRAPVGRKLEFLAQELMREANTMASKSHDSGLVEAILAIKLCVERIREQLANVE